MNLLYSILFNLDPLDIKKQRLFWCINSIAVLLWVFVGYLSEKYPFKNDSIESEIYLDWWMILILMFPLMLYFKKISRDFYLPVLSFFLVYFRTTLSEIILQFFYLIGENFESVCLGDLVYIKTLEKTIEPFVTSFFFISHSLLIVFQLYCRYIKEK